ncbi:MAG: hypothetical protein CSA49_05715, partial [Gammaproteobacteria bacterium]
RQQDKTSFVDWFAPDYVFTYDEVTNPPNGKQHIDLLSNYMMRQCNSTQCPTTTKLMVGALERHLNGSSFSWWEELKIATITGYAAIRDLIYWALIAPKNGADTGNAN